MAYLGSSTLHHDKLRGDISPRADDRVRTGDINLGKVALYQLSYIRKSPSHGGDGAP